MVMYPNRWKLFFLCLFFLSGKLLAQSDAYTGTWQMSYSPGDGKADIKLILQIAAGEKSILYPAHLLVQSDGFSGDYELLLVKKSSRELAISRNKFARSEGPFSIEAILFFLNGILDYSKDLKGEPVLRLYRMQSPKPVKSQIFSPGSSTVKNNTTEQLNTLFKGGDILYHKINDSAWRSENRLPILYPSLSPAYFGLQDTIHLTERAGVLIFPGNKKKNNDLFSVTINGRTAIEQQGIDKKDHVEEILLDTGLNILAFFADQFANNPAGNGKLLVEFNHAKTVLDFTSKADSGAMFIVAKFYCGQDQSKDKYFVNNSTAEGPLKKNEKLAGNIISTSRQLTFGIWDDAKEDGDTISININGRWLVQGFAVKNKPQFITVTLEPGTNKISFIANNLGSIPPNTSVLEIIDGNKRKSFFMEAGLGESNVVRIFYDVKAIPSHQ